MIFQPLSGIIKQRADARAATSCVRYQSGNSDSFSPIIAQIRPLIKVGGFLFYPGGISLGFFHAQNGSGVGTVGTAKKILFRPFRAQKARG